MFNARRGPAPGRLLISGGTGALRTMADGKPRATARGRRREDREPRAANFLTGAVAVMAILAAVGAAYLLVDGADILRGQGERTLAATEAPAGFVELRNAYGEAEGGSLVRMHELVSLPSAVQRADLRNLTLLLSGPDSEAVFEYAASGGKGTFTASVVRDADDSFSPDEPILTRGDLIELSIPLAANGIAAGPGDEIRHVQQVADDAARNTWKVPLNLGSGTIVHLQMVD